MEYVITQESNEKDKAYVVNQMMSSTSCISLMN